MPKAEVPSGEGVWKGLLAAGLAEVGGFWKKEPWLFILFEAELAKGLRLGLCPGASIPPAAKVFAAGAPACWKKLPAGDHGSVVGAKAIVAGSGPEAIGLGFMPAGLGATAGATVGATAEAAVGAIAGAGVGAGPAKGEAGLVAKGDVPTVGAAPRLV